MFFPKLFVSALLVSVASLATASPNPVPTSSPEDRQLEARQNPGDILNSLTSAAASAITGDGASIFTQATSVLGSVGSEVTSVAASVGDQVTSVAASVGSQVTSRAGDVLTTVESVGGQAFTIVTSAGGQALTLASPGAGVVTSAFGSVYTVVTAAAQNTGNAAPGMYATGLASPAVVGLVTIVGSALLGAVITL